MNKICKISIIITLLLSLYLSLTINKKYYNFITESNSQMQKAVNECANENSDNELIDYCNEILENSKYMVDFYSVLSSMVVFELKYLSPFSFLFLCIPTISFILKYYKNTFFPNIIQGNNYFLYLKKIIKKSYNYIWLLPATAIILFVPILFYTTLDPSYALNYGTSIWPNTIIETPSLFIIYYFLNIFLHAGVFINISMISIRIKPKFFYSLIISILIYILLEAFMEGFLGIFLCYKILKVNIADIFNIMSVYVFKTQNGVLASLGFILILFLITLFIVYLLYKNQNEVEASCRKCFIK